MPLPQTPSFRLDGRRALVAGASVAVCMCVAAERSGGSVAAGEVCQRMRAHGDRACAAGWSVGAGTRAYMDAVMALPAWRECHAAGVKEPWVLEKEEVDWPTVHKVN